MGMMENINLLKSAKSSTDQSTADLELLQELERQELERKNVPIPDPNIDDPI